MKVTYNGTQLASGGLESATGASFNGQQINDDAGYFRASAQSYFQRGNRSTTFGFGVNRGFNSESEAITFAATHLNSLATQGDIVIADDQDQVSYTLSDAILESVSVQRVDGNYVLVRYQFNGGVFA